MDAPAATESLEALPVELLSRICFCVGIMAMMQSRTASKHLHLAWQQSVRSLNIGNKSLSHEDIVSILKYVKLSKLSMYTYNSSAEHLQPWEIVTRLGNHISLECLEVNARGAFSTLSAFWGAQKLRDSLKQLRLRDTTHSLRGSDVRSLSCLSMLSHLYLDCGIISDTITIDAANEAREGLRNLQHLEMRITKLLPDSTITASFPGALTGLTSLYLLLPGAFIPDLSAQQRQQQLQAATAAVALLVNLRELIVPHPFYSAQASSNHSELRKLTLPYVMGVSDMDNSLELPDALSGLKSLEAPGAVLTGQQADAIFDMTELKQIRVRRLQPTDRWHHRTAQHCKLAEVCW